MAAAVEVERVTRIFEPRRKRDCASVLALDEGSLEIPNGEIHGLLGPNGAGKTTLQDPLDGATADLRQRPRPGHDVVADTKAVRPLIGIVFGGERASTGGSRGGRTSSTGVRCTSCRRGRRRRERSS